MTRKLPTKKSIGARQSGMTYIEMIVVLGIFSVLSTVAMFNYNGFQNQIDIKNLASDIALKIVEAQKSSLNGLLPETGAPFPGWKPAYGVYFSIDTSSMEANPSKFVYFIDQDQNGIFNTGSCSECIDQITITKGNSIYAINIFFEDGTSDNFDDLSIVFKRPGSNPTITSAGGIPAGLSYAQVSIISPKGNISIIKIYASGRIQLN